MKVTVSPEEDAETFTAGQGYLGEAGDTAGKGEGGGRAAVCGTPLQHSLVLPQISCWKKPTWGLNLQEALQDE